MAWLRLVIMAGLALVLLSPAAAAAQEINPLTGKPYVRSQARQEYMERLAREEELARQASEEYSKRDEALRKEKADEIRAHDQAVDDWLEANPAPAGTRETTVATDYDDDYNVEQTNITYTNRFGIPTHTVTIGPDGQPTGPVTLTQQGKAWESIGPRMPKGGGADLLMNDDFDGNEIIETAEIIAPNGRTISVLEFNHEGIPWRGENFDAETGRRTGAFQDERFKPPEDALGGPLPVPAQVRFVTGVCEKCRPLMERHNELAHEINARVIEMQSLSKQHQHHFKRGQKPIRMRYDVVAAELAALMPRFEAAREAVITCDKGCRPPPDEGEPPDPAMALKSPDGTPVPPAPQPPAPPVQEDRPVEPSAEIFPAGDADLAQAMTAIQAYIDAANCEGMECPVCDCAQAKAALQALYDLEAYLEAMLPYLQAAQTDHLNQLKSRVDVSTINGEQQANTILAVGVHQTLHNFGSMLLDIASVMSWVKEVVTSPKSLDELSPYEFIDRLDGLYEAMKDLESGLNTAAEVATGEAPPSPVADLVDLSGGGVDKEFINNSTSTIADVKSIVTAAVENGKDWRKALKDGGAAAAIGQIAGRYLKAYSAVKLQERQAALKDLERDAQANGLIQNQAFRDWQQVSSRRWMAEDLLTAVRAAQPLYGGCVYQACGAFTLTRPAIPNFIEEPPGGGEPRMGWGRALKWFNGAIAQTIPRLKPVPFRDECPEEEQDETRADPGESIMRELGLSPDPEPLEDAGARYQISDPNAAEGYAVTLRRMREHYIQAMLAAQAACDREAFYAARDKLKAQTDRAVDHLRRQDPTGPDAAEIQVALDAALAALALSRDEEEMEYEPCPKDGEEPRTSITREIEGAMPGVGMTPEPKRESIMDQIEGSQTQPPSRKDAIADVWMEAPEKEVSKLSLIEDTNTRLLELRDAAITRLRRANAECDEIGYHDALDHYYNEIQGLFHGLRGVKGVGPDAKAIEARATEIAAAFAMSAESMPEFTPCDRAAAPEDPPLGESITGQIESVMPGVGAQPAALPDGVVRPELADTAIQVPASFCDEFERVAFLNEVYTPTAARALANSQAARVHQNRLNALFTEYMRKEGGPIWAAIQKEMADYGPIADGAFEESNRVNGLYAQIMAVPIVPCAKLAEAEPPPALAAPSPTPQPAGDPKKPDCPPEERKKRRQPIEVGSNGKVGSGARFKSKAASTALGLAGGLLGGGGGSPLGGGGGGGGPQVVRCKIKDSEMTVFTDPLTGVSLKVGAKRAGDTMVVFADIAKSPDNGTFQAGFMENAAGDTLAPADVNICDLWGEWKLTVSWTRSTYVDGQLVSRESGGWSESGLFRIPGMLSKTDAPDGLWKRLGFSNASHGARKIAMQYKLPAGGGPVDLVIHVTRPGEDPVTTVPFALTLTEGPGGIAITQAPPIKDDCPPPVIAAGTAASIADSPPPAPPPPPPPKPSLPPATSQPRTPIPTEDLMALEKRIDEEKANNLDEERLQLLSVCRPTILPWSYLRDALYERGAKWLKELEAMVPTGPLADGVRETITAEKARVRDLMDRLRAMKEPECLPAPAEPSGPEDILEEIETPFVPA